MNIVVLTARMGSGRLPNKVIADIQGKSNILRIIDRFKRCKEIDDIVVAMPDTVEDRTLGKICEDYGIRIDYDVPGDILGQVIRATGRLYPNKKYIWVLRATQDCPFVSTELVDRAFQLVNQHIPNYDTARLWGLGEQVPVYGAAEFPTSLECLKRIYLKYVEPFCDEGYEIARGIAYEHVTADIDAHRMEYRVMYAVPPRIYRETFYRPYRLELDTEDDLLLARKIVSDLGSDAPLHQVVRYLDANPEVAKLNAHIAEKTGPMTSYTPEQRARWKCQQANHSVDWSFADWSFLENKIMPGKLPEGARVIYCRRGEHYLGYAIRESHGHVLYRPDGSGIAGRAYLDCPCGAGREWYEG